MSSSIELFGALGKLIDVAIGGIREERKNKRFPCSFNDGISSDEFKSIVMTSGKSIRRLTQLEVNGSMVVGVFLSNTGISEWAFFINFNDNGHITGNYSIVSTNRESYIPRKLAEIVKFQINNKYKGCAT